jgi:hypothetical protein
LVERLNGIEEVNGSNPLGSTNFLSGSERKLSAEAFGEGGLYKPPGHTKPAQNERVLPF